MTRSRQSAGTAKFSPDGKKLALYNYNDQLHIYDFDRSTGLLSNHKKVEVYPPDSIDRGIILFSSVEWSPNSRFIYCSSSVDLYQVDTWENNIHNGVRYIDSYNGTLDPFSTRLFLMAQGPDCKIYMTPKNGSYSLHVINKPDELGKACDFVQNAIKLPNSNSGTLPNFPRFRVDEDKKCDPTITSLFGETVYYRREIEVFPNPSNGVFQIKIPEVHRSGTFIVSNTEGKILVQKQVNWSVLEEIDISTFPSGRYNIEFYPDDQHEKIYYGKQVIKI
ncbi:MAG: T9SS type A sorting domain-containing protein [Saprospiraceae bacterium]|nr:T9SS type A sorting domain-containing protein [Saprospiraceae bacterium]